MAVMILARNIVTLIRVVMLRVRTPSLATKRSLRHVVTPINKDPLRPRYSRPLS